VTLLTDDMTSLCCCYPHTGAALQRTYDTFPQEARVRYPQLTSGIGRAPIPDLKGANFLGVCVCGWGFINKHCGG
jgi:hypothetical protein